MPYCVASLTSSVSARAGVVARTSKTIATRIPAYRFHMVFHPPVVSAQGLMGLLSALRASRLIRARGGPSRSRAHAAFEFRTERRAKLRLRSVDEATQVRPRLARINDVLDAERLRREKRRRERAKLRLDLGLASLRIGVLCDLAAKRCGDAAFDR